MRPVAAADPQLLFSYEVTSAVGLELPKLAGATYAERATFAGQVLDSLVPDVLRAVGLDPRKVETQITPGGYNLKTNASLQSKVALAEADANRLAAALGYVFRQFSVLVSDLADAGGNTGYVTVSMPKGTMNASLAQAFFLYAAGVDPGLGGGYTAFGDDMIFLNVRDGQGQPYSKLEDEAFAAAMRRAADGFTSAKATVSATGKAKARFVGNSWRNKPGGDDYVALLGGAGTPLVNRLDGLRQRQVTLILAAADRFHWR
ncbi:MAG: hypothetical protein HYR63_05475 [Proteobacteria bacterium]|nr:hypothetical protein [Pseudomonadota bacterium]MBI3495853.1 hypothetical protein [Pseudomonadota bacterium]